ncbi:MAG: T9SS type A sorting domain-containing protein, partial [Flavitalea sp.]
YIHSPEWKIPDISNTSKGIYAKNIGLAKLKTWFVYCEGDNCGSGPLLNVSNAWVDSIRKVPGNYPPRYTRLRNINPPSLYNCSDTLLHDAWSRAYDPNFRASFNFTTGNTFVNDGINLNVYEWFARQVAPVAAPAVNGLQLSENEQENIQPDGHIKPIVVSPNPFDGELSVYVSLLKPGRLTLTLSDLNGRMVQSSTAVYGIGETQVKMSANNLSRGVYILKIYGNNINTTQKVIKR